MGRPTKPRHLKVIAGTVQPCRDGKPLAEFDVLTDSPVPPEWLPNAFAIREWNRLCKILISAKLLAEADLSTLGHLCAHHGKILQKYTAGTSPTASEINALRAMQADFGLSPVTRARAKHAPNGERQNQFSWNGSRPPGGKRGKKNDET